VLIRKGAAAHSMLVWGFATFLWLVYSAGSVFYAFRGDPWSHGDWLINYSGGFVRRGITGTVALWLNEALGFSIPLFVALLQVSFGAVLFFGFAKLVRRSDLTLGDTVILLFPMGLIYSIVDPASVGRKEILIFAFAFLWVHLERNRSLSSSFKWVMAILLMPILLAHEGLAFYVPTLLLLSVLAAPEIGWRQVASRALVLGAPTLLSVGAVSLLQGDVSPDDICSPLLKVGYSIYTCEGALFFAAEGGVGDALDSFLWLEYAMPRYGVYFLAFAAATLVFWLSVSASSFETRFGVGQSGLAALSALAILSASPIFLLQVDWGRYLNILLVLLSLGIVSTPRGIQSADGPTAPKALRYKRPIVVASLIVSLSMGVSVSDGQYRSVFGNVVNAGYYFEGGLTPGIYNQPHWP